MRLREREWGQGRRGRVGGRGREVWRKGMGRMGGERGGRVDGWMG